MIKKSLILAACISIGTAAYAGKPAVEYDKYFADSTLRVDYIFAGDDHSTAIYLEGLSRTDGWAGRRHNLDKPYLRGNGQIVVTLPESGDTIYANSFSTLFQEWQNTDEAHNVAKAFEATYLVPYPKDKVDVTVSLTNNRGESVAHLTHQVDPTDILIRQRPTTEADVRVMHQSGTPAECVDIAIIAEGYTAQEIDKFYADAQRATEALFSHEPFESMADRFNVIAVGTPSGDSGPDVPRDGKWGRTAHGSHFDTFYSARYLTTQDIHGIYDSVAGLPVEHIILLVNTPIYGGGGIFNQVTISSSDHPTFKEVLVHEFGHAYAGLADEYFYEGEEDTTYPTDIEPWEPNITTLTDFDSKWADLLPAGCKVPTEVVGDKHDVLGVYEGGGYKAKGVYRPVDECRMRVNSVDYFCPVCTRAIIGITDWYTRP